MSPERRRSGPGGPDRHVGLVLPGGGARGAYQVGVLKALADLLPRRSANPFAVLSGTSAGAISAAVLASRARSFRLFFRATRSMLGECDYVVITLPLTAKTHHLFNEEMLKAMKPSAFLVNVGRGSLIEEPALIKALKKGWLAGAGLDVFETEPLPVDSPLWGMENVILSPHVSGMTPAYDERATDLFVANLRRFLTGERLMNLVDRERGY